jgi:uncharacterized membrane protein
MIGLAFYISLIGDIAYIITAIILSYLFLKKYIEYRKIELLYFGLAVLVAGITLTGFAIIGDFFNVFINIQIPIIIQYFPFGLYPFTAIFYIKSISTLVIKEGKNRIRVMILVIIASLILIVSYYILFFLDTANIGYIDNDGLFYGSPFINIIFTPIASLLVLVGSLVFVNKALATNDEVSQLKGKFILIAVILLLISALSGLFAELLGIPVEIDQIINIATRVLGFVFLYIGFILPESLRKVFLEK